MSWICDVCNLTNVNANEQCAGFCRFKRPERYDNERDEFTELSESITKHYKYKRLGFTYNELFYIRNITMSSENSNPRLTPEEQLFSDLFNHEKLLVKDMDMLTLRAHIEELEKIAFEARARYSAADNEEKERKKKSSKGPTGFARSVNIDEATSDVINTVKERQKRLTAKEKVEAGLIKLFTQSGMSLAEATKEASKKMGNQAILNVVKAKEATAIPTIEVRENKPVFNPFEKK